MIIQKFTVTAYIDNGMDARAAALDFLQNEDWVSWCDTELVSEEETDMTYPEETEENLDDFDGDGNRKES